LGELMEKAVVVSNSSAIEKNISTQKFAPGIYIVKATIGNNSSSKRLIIQ
jgi:hypothetical protein